MSEHIIKRHNKNLLLYHLVCPAKYRRDVFSSDVEETLKNVCLKIGVMYEMNFIEIGADENHVHFLVQGVPVLSPSRIVQIIKSITAKELFREHPSIKKKLWGGALWTTGYYINTVGQYGNETVIQKYVKEQGKEYKQIYRGAIQLSLFD
jgi:REP element-mobilizing transposase RayT